MSKQKRDPLTPMEQRLMLEGERLRQSGRLAEAVGVYSQALRTRAHDPRLLHAMAIAETGLQRYDDAIRRLRRAARLAPTEALHSMQLADTLRQAGKLEEAREEIARARRLDPDLRGAKRIEAEILRLFGAYEQAWEIIRPLAEGEDSEPQDVLVYARLAHRFDKGDEAIRRIDQTLEADELSDRLRADLWFRAADLHERAGRYEEAFTAAEKANGHVRRRFDIDEHERLVGGLIRFWTPERLREMPRVQERAEFPVFIVGMPRTGTSLADRMLDGHPRVHSVGERPALGALIGTLTPTNLELGVKAFRRELRRLAPQADRIVDKMPFNFLNLGFLDIALPGARVIHMRRDPLDTCLSCYMTDFDEARGFSSEQERLGRYYNGYRRLMDHWHETLDTPILDVDYEDLVREPEAQARRMIEFLDLEWDERVLHTTDSERPIATASVEQVREPIDTTSIGRAQKYRKRLATLIETLEKDGALDAPPGDRT